MILYDKFIMKINLLISKLIGTYALGRNSVISKCCEEYQTLGKASSVRKSY